MKISIEWKYRIEATTYAGSVGGWCSAFAWWLRHLADRMDAGQSVRLEYSTTPRVDPRLAADCIERGLSHANRLLADMAQQQACEEALKTVHAELFEE